MVFQKSLGGNEMKNFKIFFSQTKAMAYANKAIELGKENVKITSFKDAFGQTQHRVSWR